MSSYDIAQLVAQWYCAAGYDLRGQPHYEIMKQLSLVADDPTMPLLGQIACKIAVQWLSEQDDEFIADVRVWLEADDLFEEAE